MDVGETGAAHKPDHAHRRRLRNWRDHLKVHPAAEMFPIMSADELTALGEDIKKNGLRNRVAVIEGPDDEPILIDGRNRLDAMTLVGLEVVLEDVAMTARCRKHLPGFDPYGYVISVNVHRRHLTAEQRRDLIAKLLKATPNKSNRQIAKMVGSSHPHIGKVRAELESTGDVETVTTSIDTKGRKQPVKKKRRDIDDHLADKRAKLRGDMPSLNDEMPTEEEADESWQEALYDQACLLLERMAESTRRKFIAHIKDTYRDQVPL